MENSTDMARTIRNTGGIFSNAIKIPDTLIDNALIAEDGIAIYVSGTSKPFYLHLGKEIVIGRRSKETSETFLDLSELDGYNMGLSRRHAMIRRAKTGYEIIDLSSTNGTWLNKKRLVPEKPYPLKNGAQVRVGRLRLLIIYHSVNASRKE
jgi:hypothetical protein